MTGIVSRRGFVGTGAAAAVGAVFASTLPISTSEAQRRPQIASELVKEFVGKSHGNLARIKELVAEVPNIVNASWDWGNGDWETGLGAASHMGRVDIADFLLENKARKDFFCAAMKAEHEIVASSLAVDPTVATLPGPHRITLLFHAGLGGKVSISEMLVKGGAHDNQALHAAVWYGHYEMTKWLLENDTKDVNIVRQKRTPLDRAVEDGHTEIAALLESRGGVRRNI